MGWPCCRSFYAADMEFNKLTQVLVGGVFVCLARYMPKNISAAACRRFPNSQYEPQRRSVLGYLHTWCWFSFLPQALKWWFPEYHDVLLLACWKTPHCFRLLVNSTSCWWRETLRMTRIGWELHRSPWWLNFVLFFVLCTAMSQYSLNLEKS